MQNPQQEQREHRAKMIAGWKSIVAHALKSGFPPLQCDRLQLIAWTHIEKHLSQHPECYMQAHILTLLTNMSPTPKTTENIHIR